MFFAKHSLSTRILFSYLGLKHQKQLNYFYLEYLAVCVLKSLESEEA